jgi:CRISPR/Cas system-associated protein Cas10 (large subunit of type III CRISPR-Cas system)
MAIIFHCDYCGKKIEAADNAGGKWGKCPACHNKLYVPASESDEELKLAPVDETDLEREKRLLDETNRLTLDILKERENPEGIAESDKSAEAAASGFEMSQIELKQYVVKYLRLMADSELYEAQKIAAIIKPYGARVVKSLDKMAGSDMLEPELTGISQLVLSGLIRSLKDQIS